MKALKTIIVALFLIIACGSNVRAMGLESTQTGKISSDKVSYAPKIPQKKIPANIPGRLRKLIEKLYSPSVNEKIYALEILLRIEKENVPALPFVISMLEDLYDIEKPHENSTDTFHAQLVADLLSETGDPRAIKPLMLMLVNKNKSILEGTLLALRKIDSDWINNGFVDKALPSLIKALSNKKIDFNDEADLIDQLCKKKKIADELIRLYKKEKGNTKAFVLFMLDRISPEWMDTNAGKSIVPKLIKGLKNKNRDIQSYSAKILEKMGQKPKNKLILIHFYILTKNDKELVKIGKHAIKPLIIQFKKVDDIDSLIWTQGTLSKIYKSWRRRKDAKNLVPDFIAALKDNDRVRLYIAIKFLGGMRDSRAVKPLMAILDKKEMRLKTYTEDKKLSLSLVTEKDVRISVIEALEKIGDERAIKQIFNALNSNFSEVRMAAFNALQKFEWEPKDLQERLKYIVAIRDKDKLSEMGRSAKKQIVKMLIDSRGYSKRNAASTLKDLGWKPSNEKEKIAVLIADENWNKLIEMGSVSAIKAFISHIERESYMTYPILKKAETIADKGGSEIVDILIPVLKNKDRLIRRFAADILCKIGDKQAIKPLIDLLMDEDIYNKELEDIWSYTSLEPAARALGQFGDKRAIKPLIHVLGFGSKVSMAASESLVKLGEPVVEPIINTLKAKNSLAVICAIDILVKMKDKRAVEPILHALKHEVIEVRQKAAVAIGEIADERAIEPLIESFDKITFLERENVIKVMFKLDPEWTYYDVAKDIVPLLIDDLDNYDVNMRKRSLRLLKKLGDSDAIEPLVDALRIEKDNDLRRSILEALEELDWEPSNVEDEVYYFVINKNKEELIEFGDFAVEPLVEILKDDNKDYSEFAASVLEILNWEPETLEDKIDLKIVNERWRDLVKICIENEEMFRYIIEDRDSYVKEGLIGAMRKKKGSDIDEMIIFMLNDKDKAVQLRAANALVKRKHPHAVEYLLPFLKDKSSNTKVSVAKILLNIGDPYAIKHIIDVFAHCDNETSNKIIRILVKFGESAVEPLIDAIKDENKKVRTKAVVTLGMIGNSSAVKPLVFAIKESDAELQQEIVKTLEAIGDSAAIKPLITVFKEEPLKIKIVTAEALCKLAPDWADNDEVKSMVPDLITGLKEKNKSKLSKIIKILGIINDSRATWMEYGI
jgi:HEAT repeat protein